MKITVLAENTCSSADFGCEHGLSLFIETGNYKILFDTGQTFLFCENAEKLGIDLSRVDFAVLSHGHYDHGGGLKTFFEVNKKAPVYISRYAFGEYYHGSEKYIGLDKSIKESERIIFAEDVFCIKVGITLYSCNDKVRNHNIGAFGLTRKKGEEYSPDPFLHEQYLEIQENGKTILISGCSHKGIMNIADWFKPDILVGGFHFSKLDTGDTLKTYAQYLDSFDTDFYTCHCTGEKQFLYMKKYMNCLSYIRTGDVIEF